MPNAYCLMPSLVVRARSGLALCNPEVSQLSPDSVTLRFRTSQSGVEGSGAATLAEFAVTERLMISRFQQEAAFILICEAGGAHLRLKRSQRVYRLPVLPT